MRINIHRDGARSRLTFDTETVSGSWVWIPPVKKGTWVWSFGDTNDLKVGDAFKFLVELSDRTTNEEWLKVLDGLIEC